MTGPFTSESQVRLLNAVLGELRTLGYRNDLLCEGYGFSDWFLPNTPERKVAAAAFGQTPTSYDTACLGVALAGNSSGHALIRENRALGAPILFEIGDEFISQWTVGSSDKTTVQSRRFGLSEVKDVFSQYGDLWKPRELLRTKTVATARWEYQGSLFAGLIPELEENIRKFLDPMLRNAVAGAVQAFRDDKGRDPDEHQVFRLTFALLAGKVFRDRQHREFLSLDPESDPDDVIRLVAKHYREDWPELLTPDSRQAAFDCIWRKIDFRNLSVDVLSHSWSQTLVTDDLRLRFGIHRTPRSIVRYIVDRIPFENIPEDERIVVEPCCGSAVFLVAGLNRLRDLLPPDLDQRERHKYFKKMLRGFEREAYGAEVSKLSLALTDYPNANGWKIDRTDVFTSNAFANSLRSARVVLCNPPYENFTAGERIEYGTEDALKPLTLINRVLATLHPEGVIGFVLPRVFVDGLGYQKARQEIARRFGKIELVTLPDRGWDHADKETVLVIATEPNHGKKHTRVIHRKVREKQWRDFDWYHRVSSEDAGDKTEAEAGESLAIPELSKVWHHLRHCTVLGDIAQVHRGIEWESNLIDPATREETGNRDRLVRKKGFKHSVKGIPPQAKPFFAFECPPTAYLDMSEEERRGNAHDYAWSQPKVILNSKTKSRGPWRIAAFTDTEGLACYQTFTAVWPNRQSDLITLTAVLNGPVANAFVATREGKTDITNDTLEAVPVPSFSDAKRSKLESLVSAYCVAADRAADEILSNRFQKEAVQLLRAIDATVLDAYDLPPRLERMLLDYFRGEGRTSRIEFGDYFPVDFSPRMSYSEYVSQEWKEATGRKFLEKYERLAKRK